MTSGLEKELPGPTRGQEQHRAYHLFHVGGSFSGTQLVVMVDNLLDLLRGQSTAAAQRSSIIVVVCRNHSPLVKEHRTVRVHLQQMTPIRYDIKYFWCSQKPTGGSFIYCKHCTEISSGYYVARPCRAKNCRNIAISTKFSHWGLLCRPASSIRDKFGRKQHICDIRFRAKFHLNPFIVSPSRANF